MEDAFIKKPKVITNYEACVYKQSVIDKWKPKSEVWALLYGDAILGSMCCFGGIFITFVFRKELKLRPFARMSCYMPVVGVSSLTNTMVQEFHITPHILRKNTCPLCVTTNSFLLQAFFGIVYPVMTSTVTCLYMADKLLTYPVPPLLRAPREAFQLVKKIVLKNKRPLFVISALHMIAAPLITYQKQRNFYNMGDAHPKNFQL